MKKHVLSITYTPKIEPVQDGRCSQTIRAGRKVSVGDEILFHGWSGRPYLSKWSWRKRVEVIQIIPIIVSEAGVKFPMSYGNQIIPWTHKWINGLAEMDFICPPTGLALRDVLLVYLKVAKGEEAECQIIRWSGKL